MGEFKLFQEIENYLYNEKWIMLTVSSNYKTALKATNIMTMNSCQDGAVYNKKVFLFNNSGNCNVYDIETKKAMLDANPELRKMYNEEDKIFEIFYLSNLAATIYSMIDEPEVIC